MANRTKRTPQREQAILTRIRQGGSIYAACQDAGIGRTTLHEWRTEDPAFDAKVIEAYEDGTDTLEEVALSMAVQGSVPVLLATLKARRREKWGDKVVNEHTGKDGGPIVFDPGWSALRSAILSATADHPDIADAIETTIAQLEAGDGT